MKYVKTLDEFVFPDWVKTASNEFMKKNFSQVLEGIRSTKIGKYAENLVCDMLNNKGYNAVESPGSRTPADVWGLKQSRLYSHLILIQVKGSATDTPVDICNDSIVCQGMNDLAIFLKRDYLNKAKPNRLIVTWGYVGISNINYENNSYKIFKSKLLGIKRAGFSENDSDLKLKAVNVVKKVHIF